MKLDNYYSKHLFFCTNQKQAGKKCCMDGDAEAMWLYAKQKLAAMELPEGVRVRVNKAGCLGRCSLGPGLVIYPEGVWYRYQHQSDIDTIIEQHVIQGKLVEHLIMEQPA